MTTITPPVFEPVTMSDDLRDALLTNAFADGPQEGDVVVVVCLRPKFIGPEVMVVEHFGAIRTAGERTPLSREVIAEALRIEANIAAGVTARDATVDEGDFS